jgi:hypothetical protein
MKSIPVWTIAKITIGLNRTNFCNELKWMDNTNQVRWNKLLLHWMEEAAKTLPHS